MEREDDEKYTLVGIGGIYVQKRRKVFQCRTGKESVVNVSTRGSYGTLSVEGVRLDSGVAVRDQPNGW